MKSRTLDESAFPWAEYRRYTDGSGETLCSEYGLDKCELFALIAFHALLIVEKDDAPHETRLQSIALTAIRAAVNLVSALDSMTSNGKGQGIGTS